MDKTGVIYMSIAFHNYITSENQLKNEGAMQKNNKIIFYCPRAFILLRFFKRDKTGVFYMYVTFHSHITCENWPKNY